MRQPTRAHRETTVHTQHVFDGVPERLSSGHVDLGVSVEVFVARDFSSGVEEQSPSGLRQTQLLRACRQQLHTRIPNHPHFTSDSAYQW